MYNKLFTSILDSSIWLEEPATKVVWITLIAAMDEEGFAHFASLKNLANRSVLSVEETEAAVKVLESPDPNSSDPDHEGRRIERVPGGWMVLNARKYHTLTTRAIAKEKTRQRVTRFRNKKRMEAEVKFPCNAGVTPDTVSSLDNCNDPVTLETRSNSPSDTDTDSEAKPLHYTGIPIPDGYSAAAQGVIGIWHEVCCGAGLNFLPVDKFTQTAEGLAGAFGDPDEARKLFLWCVERERAKPSRLRKTLVRVLSDVTTGEGFFSSYTYEKPTELDDDEIPF